MDHHTRVSELPKIVWRWRSGQLSRRTALRLLTSLGLSLGGSLATISSTRGLDHHPGHFGEPVDPEQTAVVVIVDTDVDTDYDSDLNHLLKNPERGMYFPCVPKKAGQEIPDIEEKYYCSDDAHEYACPSDVEEKDYYTLINSWLWLADWCDKPLKWDGLGSTNTSQVLDEYAEGLEFYRRNGYKVVFRPRYDLSPSDASPSTCGYQAKDIERQENHIDEIAKMLGEYKDVVAFIQAGYLGKWGEWNEEGGASTAPLLFTTSMRNRIIDRVLTAYGDAGLTQQVELRRPVFVKAVMDRHKEELWPPPNLGLHNDCFMTSGSDTGTYSNPVQPPFDSDSPEFPSVQAAKTWAQQELTPYASFGGETCPHKDDNGNYTEPWRVCSNMVDDDGDPATVDNDDPATLHMSYLNGDYAADDDPLPGMLGAVSTWQCGGCYDEIRRRLGYRFEVTTVEYTQTVKEGENFLVRVFVHNTGWSKLHKPRQAKLVLRDGSAVLPPYDFSSGDVASWALGESTTISVYAPSPSAGEYEVRLWIPDPDAVELDNVSNPVPEVPIAVNAQSDSQKSRIAYAVKLATLRDNANVFDYTTGENYLGIKITVEPQLASPQ